MIVYDPTSIPPTLAPSTLPSPNNHLNSKNPAPVLQNHQLKSQPRILRQPSPALATNPSLIFMPSKSSMLQYQRLQDNRPLDPSTTIQGPGCYRMSQFRCCWRFCFWMVGLEMPYLIQGLGGLPSKVRSWRIGCKMLGICWAGTDSHIENSITQE